MKKKVVFKGAGILLALLIVGAVAVYPRPGVTGEQISRSVDLCRNYMIGAQTDLGNFIYEYNWVTGVITEADNQVRQAGGLWALAIYYSEEADADVETAIRQGLDFMLRNSRLTSGGGRYIVYPGDASGKLGTVALVTLTLVDYLRSVPDPESERNSAYRQSLEELVVFLNSSRTSSSLWHQRYRHSDGLAYGGNSPYFDGETLLALAKYSRYFRGSPTEGLLVSADAAYDTNVLRELGKRPASAVLNGFYQWGTMTFFELATSGWENTAKFAGFVFAMADWKIDVDRIQDKRGGASSYEGLAHAYGMAEIRNDRRRIARYGRVLGSGLAKLLPLQVGGPDPHARITAHKVKDPKALGGVQNTATAHAIRIDIVQHQMSAFIFSRRFFFQTVPAKPRYTGVQG